MLTSQFISCPYCGEGFEAVIDPSAGSSQYIEDCPVCCRPITLHLRVDDAGEIDDFAAHRDDD